MEVRNWWETTVICIAGESNGLAGFTKRRAQLEKLIEPHLSKKKTADAIRFRGKTCYLSALDSGSATEQQLWSAIWALQCIYRADIAIERGDVEAAARWAYGVGRSHIELEFASKLGTDPASALARIQRTARLNRAKGRTTKKSVPKRLILQTALARHAHKKNWLKSIATELARGNFNACPKTISGWLKEAGLERSDYFNARQRRKR